MNLPQPVTAPDAWRSRFAPHVAIVGAGFSGTMLAINLLEQPGVQVTLIEAEDRRVGRGVAYSAVHQGHVLNVRAANMSVYPDRPDDFLRWLANAGNIGPSHFATRATYGQYLGDCLADAQRRHGRRLTVVSDRVLDIDLKGGSVSLGMASGALVTADRVVLAVGNLPPHDPPGVYGARLPRSSYASDPWALSFEEGLNPTDAVMLLGTGLTAIDAILRLTDAGFPGPIMALSRRGLRPHSHLVHQDRPAPQLSRPGNSLSALLHWARRQSRDGDWRGTVDSLRPITQLLWASADTETRGRFLRHLRPYWDIHRHRLAPEIGARIDALVASGQLRFHAGKVDHVDALANGLEVHWRPRGGDALRSDAVQRLINCTGPQGDLWRTDDPMLRRLLSAGHIRADPLRLGLDVDRQGRVLSRDGVPSERLLAAGPITRGDLWEVVAVPDIRGQVSAMAARLTQSHWVGGEGL